MTASRPHPIPGPPRTGGLSGIPCTSKPVSLLAATLSRSLRDFLNRIESFDRRKVSFASVTERIDTTSSAGRLFLNMILAFAQFEREVAAERILDKIATAKRKGKYVGGRPLLGYDVDREKMRLWSTRKRPSSCGTSSNGSAKSARA